MSGTPLDHAEGQHIQLDGPLGQMTPTPHGGTLAVEVVSPEAVLFRGRANAVVVPAYDGLLGILPHHAPMLALLGRGVLILRGSEGNDRSFTVNGGFVQVRADTVRVVAEEASAS
jgi:F-type H+-transporting ATPase subunit epsilon